MARQKEMQHMLDDIRLEIELTRSYIGQSHFSDAVMAAMAAVPRDIFVPEEVRTFAFHNGPLPIGHGQTISQPYIVALMTELLATNPEDTVLEIGTGSGYQTAVLSRLVRQVYSMEIIGALGEQAKQKLLELGYDNIETRIGDGYLGWPEHAPYDGIIVTAAADGIPPALEAQLKPGGRMVIPVGPPYRYQVLMLVEKDNDGELTRREVLGVSFVPLVGG